MSSRGRADHDFVGAMRRRRHPADPKLTREAGRAAVGAANDNIQPGLLTGDDSVPQRWHRAVHNLEWNWPALFDMK
jgi:hypothetical protein